MLEISYTPRFVRSFKKLPDQVKLKAEEREDIFRKNWKDRRLKVHKLRGELYIHFSFSVDFDYRIIFIFTDYDKVVFEDVGKHDI